MPKCILKINIRINKIKSHVFFIEFLVIRVLPIVNFIVQITILFLCILIGIFDLLDLFIIIRIRINFRNIKYTYINLYFMFNYIDKNITLFFQ